MSLAEPEADVTESTPGAVAALYDRQCAGEKIHLLGTVQAHGFVLVVDIERGSIVQVSEGVPRHWPGIVAATDLLGTRLDAWARSKGFDAPFDLHDLPLHVPALLRLELRDLVAASRGDDGAVLQGYECMGHAVGPYAVLEWIATGVEREGRSTATGLVQSGEFEALSAVLVKLRSARSLDDYFAECVAELQSMSGYDRVMLYRFLPDWSGDIVAEHAGAGFEKKYLGLRFPATDIPAQARKLYESNTLRVLADTESRPDRLLPALLPDGVPLDQSYSLLRSLSAVHQTYLRNMGVRATLTISLMIDGKLWGMLACHHHQPWLPPHDTRNFMRSACDLIASVVGTRIEDLTILEQKRRSAVFSKTLTALRRSAQTDGATLGLIAQSDGLCETFEATRWGFRVGGVDRVSGFGVDDPPALVTLDRVASLAADLPCGGVRQFCELGNSTPPGLPGLADAAGVLIARLPAGRDGFCFFVRPDVVRETNWAGDPDKLTVVATDEGPRLEPRRSFARWKQIHSGSARAWDPSDEEAVAALATVIGDAYGDEAHREVTRQLDWRVRHDDLTGLLNRSVIQKEVTSRLAVAGGQVALFLIDIDHFKRINDSLGHAIGDQVLQEAARRFARVAREGDLTIRMGGDEFLIISDLEVVTKAMLERSAQRLHAAIAEDFRGEGWTLHVRISVGVAFSPDHGSDPVTLIRHADMALYEAKGQGRSRSAIFNSAVESRIRDAADIEAQIEQALIGDEFRLHYQPKVDLRTHRVIGLEALVRWQHPERGLLGPDLFIPLAEGTGQISGIGRWVIGEATSQLAGWRRRGIDAWPVAVNVSFIQIVDGSLVPNIREACARWAVPFDWLELELTETVVMENTQQSVAVLTELTDLGMKVSLDDFGTGYSSLAYVRQLPLDCLKIDRSFVGSLEGDPQSAIVTKGVIGLARGLNLTTVAEGIETMAQLKWLIQHQCDIGQGDLFSRPVPASELPSAIRAIEAASWA